MRHAARATGESQGTRRGGGRRSRPTDRVLHSSTASRRHDAWVADSDLQVFTRYPAYNAAGRPNVLHLYHVKRPGQTRGEPYFAPVLTAFKDLGDGFEAELVKQRVAACFAAFVTKINPYGTLNANTNTDANGNKLDGVEPGMIHYLAEGESVTFGDPGQPSGSFAPFVEAVLRSIGSSLGLPLELVLKDFSKTNYSSARAALLEARKFFKRDQSWLAARLCQPCWEWVLEEAWLMEELPAVDLMGAQREDWMRASWVGSGWGWVDPVKEVESSTMAVDGGLSTLADECAAQGRDWEDVMNQRKREKDLMDELGLTPAPPIAPGLPGMPGVKPGKPGQPKSGAPVDPNAPTDQPPGNPPVNPVQQAIDDYVGAQ
jgi:phage portal protein, lambda family